LARESPEPPRWRDPPRGDEADLGARLGQATADLMCAMSAIHEAAARVQGAWIDAMTRDEPALLERLTAAGHALRRAATLLECDAAIGATIPPTREPAAIG
jgi:hypothetical protein